MSKNILWKSVLDNRYNCQVEQNDDVYGILTIKDGTKKLLERQISMNYSSVFGPSAMDISEWEAQSIEFIGDKR